MKKTLLIIAIVLCVAVAGAALALTRNDADSVTGTLTADSYLALSLSQCETSKITVTAEKPENYIIQCDVTKAGTVTDTCTLTIELEDGTEKSLDNVTIKVYSDDTYKTLIDSQTGEGSIEISNISTTTTYYATIELASGLTQQQTAAVGGKMVLSFEKTEVNP